MNHTQQLLSEAMRNYYEGVGAQATAPTLPKIKLYGRDKFGAPTYQCNALGLTRYGSSPAIAFKNWQFARTVLLTTNCIS